MIIEEDYVSFETAKLLKEKGFDWPCLMCYTSDKKLGNYGHYNSYKNSDVFSMTAPTLQMAMKWLRVVYNLEIYPYHNSPDNRHNSEWWFEIIKYPNSVAEYESGIGEEVDSYEKACEVAIRYCIENLI